MMRGPTLLVAPMFQMPPAAILARVSLPVRHDGTDHILMLSELGAIERRGVGPVRGSLLDHEDDIRRALDRLFSGF